MLGSRSIRLVTHLDVDEEAIGRACAVLPAVAATVLQRV
jgi:hypothetical protein